MAGRGLVGHLERHMYCTRHAAQGWQDEYSVTLLELGFTQGLACPCGFYHPQRQLYSTIHGGDFTTAGKKANLDWFEAAMEKYDELTKGGRLGPGDSDAKQGIILNRVIRWTATGIEYEADPRQVERMLEENSLEGANSVATPGIKLLATQIADDNELPENEVTGYRARAARANYLAADRPDIQFAAKEACRWMSKPTRLGNEGLKRLCRYLGGKPRLVFKYPLQVANSIECYSDTDWSGCLRTRKSTSGGCLMVGNHIIKTSSSTQPTVSLSSAEAEFYGVRLPAWS